jgi:TRAP transporter TAXI family solute receptor
MPVRLVEIKGDIVEALHKDFSFYYPTEIPAGSYPGVDTATISLGSSAVWLVNIEIDPDLVYAITESLWNPATAKLFTALDPIGSRIRLSRALEGLSVPLHPGAVRFYREKGMPVDAAPKVAGEPAEQKGP